MPNGGGVAGPPPSVIGAASRKVHGTAGSFDLPWPTAAHSPTTEPRSAAGGTGSVRVGFLLGDVNGTRSVSLTDVLTVNAVMATQRMDRG